MDCATTYLHSKSEVHFKVPLKNVLQLDHFYGQHARLYVARIKVILQRALFVPIGRMHTGLLTTEEHHSMSSKSTDNFGKRSKSIVSPLLIALSVHYAVSTDSAVVNNDNLLTISKCKCKWPDCGVCYWKISIPFAIIGSIALGIVLRKWLQKPTATFKPAPISITTKSIATELTTAFSIPYDLIVLVVIAVAIIVALIVLFFLRATNRKTKKKKKNTKKTLKSDPDDNPSSSKDSSFSTSNTTTGKIHSQRDTIAGYGSHSKPKSSQSTLQNNSMESFGKFPVSIDPSSSSGQVPVTRKPASKGNSTISNGNSRANSQIKSAISNANSQASSSKSSK